MVKPSNETEPNRGHCPISIDFGPPPGSFFFAFWRPPLFAGMYYIFIPLYQIFQLLQTINLLIYKAAIYITVRYIFSFSVLRPLLSVFQKEKQVWPILTYWKVKLDKNKCSLRVLTLMWMSIKTRSRSGLKTRESNFWIGFRTMRG